MIYKVFQSPIYNLLFNSGKYEFSQQKSEVEIDTLTNAKCGKTMEIQNFKSAMVLQPGIGHIFVIKVGKLEIQQRKLTLALHD